MSLASRGTRAAARCLKSAPKPQSTRRYASDSHGHGHGHAHGQGESALHLKDANPSGNEGFGPGLYITLAVVPLFYVSYTYGGSYWDQLYQQYKEGKQRTADADELHQAVLSEAVRDRARLSSYPREMSGPSLHYPEMFNAGSPWNQAAGHSHADMSQLEQHYKKVHAEAEQERQAKFNDGKIKSVYD